MNDFEQIDEPEEIHPTQIACDVHQAFEELKLHDQEGHRLTVAIHVRELMDEINTRFHMIETNSVRDVQANFRHIYLYLAQLWDCIDEIAPPTLNEGRYRRIYPDELIDDSPQEDPNYASFILVNIAVETQLRMGEGFISLHQGSLLKFDRRLSNKHFIRFDILPRGDHICLLREHFPSQGLLVVGKTDISDMFGFNRDDDGGAELGLW